MELIYGGDLKNEFYNLTPEEKLMLSNYDFQWCNSRNISGFQFLENDLILRLHNGSMYLFENVIGNVHIKLTTTIREDLIGKLVRNKIKYYFVGVLRMESDSNETDKELLYYYVDDKNIDKTLKLNSYNIENVFQEYTFRLPSDDSILEKSFHIAAIIERGTTFIEIGIIKVLKIIESDWEEFIKIKVLTTNEVDSAIKFLERKYDNYVDYIFTPRHT